MTTRARKPRNGNGHSGNGRPSADALWAELRRHRTESRALIGGVAAAGLVLLGFAWQTVSVQMDLVVKAAESVSDDVRSVRDEVKRVVDKTEDIRASAAETRAHVAGLKDDVQRLENDGRKR